MIIALWIYKTRRVADAAVNQRPGVAGSNGGTAVGQIALITIRVCAVAIVIDDAVHEPASIRRAESDGIISSDSAIHQRAGVRGAAAVGHLAITSQEAVINIAISHATAVGRGIVCD